MTFKKIGFVTDSTCDLPSAIVDRYAIGIAPCFLNYNNESYPDDESVITRDEFYRLLPKIRPFPTTSAMSPAIAESVIDAAFAKCDHLFVLTVSSKLSAVYNVMMMAAKRLPHNCVTVIDSQSLAMGLGFQVIIGAEVAEATGDPVQVEAAIRRVQSNNRLYVALDSLDYLRRSGRVSWAAANVGMMLQIKPIISVSDGLVHSARRVRTFGRARDELIKMVKAELPIEKLAIMQASDLASADFLHDQLEDLTGVTPMRVSVTPSIITHTGPQSVGVTFVKS